MTQPKRPVTRTDILQAITLLSSLKKPNSQSPEVMHAAYEIALDGVPADALVEATKHLLKHAKFMPSPSELYSEVRRIENAGMRKEEHAKRLEWDEDKAKPASGTNVFRAANNREKYQVLQQLGLDPKPFLAALDNVSALGFQMAANRIRLKRPSWDIQPLTPQSLRSAIDRMEAEMRWRERSNDQPPLSKDPEAQKRSNELWAMAFGPKPKGFNDAAKDAAAERKERGQPEPSEEERLEALRRRGHEPTQPTEALLRTLRDPMNPPKPEG